MKKPPTQIYHAFTTKSNGIVNRLLTLVTIADAFDPDNLPDPLPIEYRCMALWDTGATASVIGASTAQALGLIPSGVVNTRHAGGAAISNTYIVNIRLPNNVGFVGVRVSEFADEPTEFGAIIGMDIIASGDFAVTNVSQKTILSFRTPSIAMIDYVSEANHATFASTGRNDPCPCGKMYPDGRRVKFKDCHLKTLD